MAKSSLVVPVVLRDKDWDPSLAGWRCPVLRIPGATVTKVFRDGAEVAISVDHDAELVRPTGPDKSGADAVAMCEIKRKLISLSLGVVVTALASVLVAAITAYGTFQAAVVPKQLEVDQARAAAAGCPKPLACPDVPSVSANDLARVYKSRVLDARGDFEALAKYPGQRTAVASKTEQLARLMLGLDDAKLDEARAVIKYEYGGWAWLIAARTTDEKTSVVRKCREAIGALERAVDLIGTLRGAYSKDPSSPAGQAYEWAISPDSEDLNRTRYLLATAYALDAEMGGRRSDDARETLRQVSESFLKTWPPKTVPELWKIVGKK